MSGTPRARSVPDGASPGPPVLVLTRIWPTASHPSLGTFIRSRAAGVAGVRVVHPRWPGLPTLVVYAVLLVDALRSRSRIRGVEAHMIIPTGFVGLLVARLRRVPLVVYAHGRDVRRWKGHPPPIRWLARLVATNADRLVTNSEDTAAAIRRLGGSPQVATPGVDLRRFGPTERPAQQRVLYLGGRNRRKGYAVAARLADTLVGPWLREVDPDEVPALMAAHDVVLVPSVAEPFGVVAVEAIACGRWVVASAVGGLRDIVVDGVNGTLVADGDFAGALARVPDYDPYEVARTAERFSLERWQATLAGIWDEVAPLTPEAADA
jgi:glycosyltransferase involved in cell wall biosynthesis